MDMNTIVSAEVAKASVAVQQHRADWFVVDTLYGGTQSMRAAGQTFLPKEPKETDKDYANRLQRSTLDNYYKQAIRKSVAKVFSKDISVADAPIRMIPLLEDIDSQQRNLTQFCKDVFEDAMNHGVSYILVDLPKMPMDAPFKNKAEELASGIRPYWVKVSSSSVLEARSTMMGGSEKLSLFRFMETISELTSDTMGEVTTRQIREYHQFPDANGNPGPVEFVVYREDKDKGWFLKETGIVSSSSIPIAPVYTNRTGFYLGKPPMMELAELNASHWAQSSDLQNIIHIVTVPFLLAKGLAQMDANGQVKSLDISVHGAIQTPNTEAKVEWIEHQGSAVKSAQEHIDRLVDRMEYLGSQLTTQTANNLTATQAAISAAESNSDLKSMALGLQDGVNAALYFTAELMGEVNYGKAMVNTSYSVDYVAKDTMAQVISLYDLGLLTKEDVVAEAKRRNILDATYQLKQIPQT